VKECFDLLAESCHRKIFQDLIKISGVFFTTESAFAACTNCRKRPSSRNQGPSSQPIPLPENQSKIQLVLNCNNNETNKMTE